MQHKVGVGYKSWCVQNIVPLTRFIRNFVLMKNLKKVLKSVENCDAPCHFSDRRLRFFKNRPKYWFWSMFHDFFSHECYSKCCDWLLSLVLMTYVHARLYFTTKALFLYIWLILLRFRLAPFGGHGQYS